MKTPRRIFLIKHLLKKFANVHRGGGKPDIFIFSSARSGSTLLMELIHSQNGFKFCNQPLSISKNSLTQSELGVSGIEELYLNPGCELKVQEYFKKILKNEITIFNQMPFHRNHRFITDRIVFKVLHCGDNMIESLRRAFAANIVYLVRHPIAVSLSRTQVSSRLKLFRISEGYRNLYTPEQVRMMKAIIRKGDIFELGIGSWCLENYFPLNNPDRVHWVTLSYEELMVSPHDSVKFLAHKLDLPDPEKMLSIVHRPSASTYKSNQATQEFFKGDLKRTDRMWLVDKWKERVNSAQERTAFDILEVFGIDAYVFGRLLPNRKYLIFGDRG